MARSRTVEAKAKRVEEAPAAAAPAQDEFTAEFRELARQRRFVRAADAGGSPQQVDEVPAPTWRDMPAPPRQRAAPAAAAASDAPQGVAAGPAPSTRRAPRMSEDQRAMLAELSRMSDRLVEAREQLAVQTARAVRAEADLAAAGDRMMAARALVQDAQRATRESAERCALLEGRCDALQEALELAVNASVVTRWRWRRELRRAAADQ